MIGSQENSSKKSFAIKSSGASEFGTRIPPTGSLCIHQTRHVSSKRCAKRYCRKERSQRVSQEDGSSGQELMLRSSTSYPAIANAPLPAEGSASFSNLHFWTIVLVAPYLITRLLPFRTGWITYSLFFVICFIPAGATYWNFLSKYGSRINEKVPFPGKPIEQYLDLMASSMEKYKGKKIPMQVFHDAYFDGEVDFKGDVLKVMEYRHDWATFEFTPAVRQAGRMSPCFPRVSADASRCSNTSSPNSFPKSSFTPNHKTKNRSGITTTGETISTLGSLGRGWFTLPD